MGVVEGYMSMSLDGFVTGPNASGGQALGDGGAVLHAESAIGQAKAAAGDKNVHIMGGASTADQALRLGLVDLGGHQIALERIGLIEGPVANHLRFRVVR